MNLKFFRLLCTLLLIFLIFIGCSGNSINQNSSKNINAAVKIPQSRTIAEENQLEGTSNWRAKHLSTGEIQAYANKISINLGEKLDLFISTRNPGTGYDVDIYRLGYYQNLGGRLYQHKDGLIGEAQGWWSTREGPHNLPTVASTTRLVNLDWKKSFTIETGSDWVTGYYLIKLTTTDGFATYVPFILRDDYKTPKFLVKAPVLTWEAYNPWGGASLYGHYDSNNKWISGKEDTFANHVSFNRPMSWESGILPYDLNMVSWLEKQGYDLGYFTDLDAPYYSNKLNQVKGLLSIGHDEYWIKEIRDYFENAKRLGVNLAFFGSNPAYWQVRMEADLKGNPNRIVVCYKLANTDPIFKTNPELTTVRWRESPINRPENELVGVMFEEIDDPNFQNWNIKNPEHWVFKGLTVKKGDYVPNIVGYEYDKIFNNGKTPNGIEVIAESPVINELKKESVSDTTIYTDKSGSIVFATGTLWWSYGLEDIIKNTKLHTNNIIQVVTQNVLSKFLEK